jgi:hypothetical protein
MGLLKKITRPISKFLDKVVPNEIKPALPYLAAFAPFMMGPQSGIMGSSMWRRALMSGAFNLGSQLSQEGSEGEFDPLSLILAGSTGAMTSPDAPGFFKGMQKGPTGTDQFGNISVPYSPDTGIMSSIKHGIGKGGETAAKFLAEQGNILRPGGEELTLKNALTAGALPVSHGTGDLAMADARRALRDYEAQMAADESQSLIDDDGRRMAIRAAMEAAGHIEDDILDALSSLGLRSGGIVSLNQGGRVGLLGGGNPDDYPEQEAVTPWQLQQEEGVPIGPMVNDSLQKRLLEDFQRYKSKGGKLPLKQFAVMWMRENAADGGRIGKRGGGVASVLPRNKEADYRGGGVIPVGSRERADDVPARLSKNEFVMTADAVRAAGGGSINKGAKRMYNLMHNLEARV